MSPRQRNGRYLDEECPLPGLRAPVELLLDEFGVPHLYAESDPDLFRAQGFNAARERLFQLDLWRRRGLGLLAAAFGERFVESDRAARLFRYRGDLAEEWAAYGPDTESIVAAFVGGINAYIDLCERRPELLPLEFVRIGHRPGRWDAADVPTIRTNGLYGNVEQELARALTVRDFGPAVEDLRRVREPHRPVTVPDGLDLDLLADEVLADYRLAVGPPPFAAAADPGLPGSNNWVLGASRSATGRPILANDPHRAISLPSLRYLCHLSAPGLDVIGAGEPALPGISIGHNGRLAFGLTILPIDQEDLYVYRTDAADPDRYRYRDGWEPMRVVSERIEVAGGDPVEVELRFTRHGPVVYRDPERRVACAVRAAWLESGMAPYLGGLAAMRAHTAAEFTGALSRWGAPGENQVYAVPEGDIGWVPAGRMPVRPNWDGTLPVPGDGRYEWDGWLPAAELPGRHNPEGDWLATANQQNLPGGFLDSGRTVTQDWYPPYRYRRLAERLAGRGRLSVADCLDLQQDTVNVAAREVIAVLAGWVPPSDLEPLAGLLRGWDCDEAAGSAAAAVFQVWSVRHLRPALLRDALAGLVVAERQPAALRRLLTEPGLNTQSDLAILRALAAEPARLDAVLTESLSGARDELVRLLGPDPDGWRWGHLHHAAPAHPLAGELAEPWTTLPRVPRPGSGDTVLCTGYDAGFRQTDGASFRIVVDVGDWDASRAMNAPGQSGRPDDPGWDELYRPWADGWTFPLRYSRKAVLAAAHQRCLLVPDGDPDPA